MDPYETTIYHAVIIAGLFLICLVVFYVVSVMRNQRKHAELQRRYFLNEISLLERERTRVACDLHDELAPRLALTKFQLDSLARLPAANPETAARASENLVQVMLRLGEIAVNLNASKLLKKGLHFALKDFFLETESVSAVNISFVYEVDSPLPPDSGIHLYRIAQEIVHNTVKHAAASLLEVHIKQRFGKLYLLFRDNGKGFPYEQTCQEGDGIGLQSIRSRTGMLGGKLQCHSAPGRGTSYFFEFPFQQTPPHD